jgi:hypothetical protein
MSQPRLYKIISSEKIILQPSALDDAGSNPVVCPPVVINIVRICRKHDDPLEEELLTAEDIVSSFDMKQCAVAMSVGPGLRCQFHCNPDTLQCARSATLGFTRHFGFLVRRFKRLKPSHKGSPPQTVVRGGHPVNRRE